MSSQHDFHRIKRLPPSVFIEVSAMKARARAAGGDIIDFGMGNPGQPTPAHIVNQRAENVQRPRQVVRYIKTFLGKTGQVLEASEKQRIAGTEQ
jgi:aspartate/methionine/tyrosine aminotransferase